MTRTFKRLFLISVPMFLLGAAAAAVVVEVWVRVHWDERRGTPGLFISHPVRLEALAPDYSGWFAGVPLRINRLGFRDPREYGLAKSPGTFRIVVLGDSVTFGHASIFEQTWTYLFEQRLKAWRPQVDWQVWNLGVPGYNTSQELAYLLEVGPRFQPDLVIVGFFGNDFVDNHDVAAPSRTAIWTSRVKSFVRRRVYSWEWYRRVYLQLRFRARRSERDLLGSVATQEQLLARPTGDAMPAGQELTEPRPLTDAELDRDRCRMPPRGFSVAALRATPGFDAWLRTVDAFQQLHRNGTYHILFFVNDAPASCPSQDVFDPRPTGGLDQYLLSILGRDTPAVSSHDAFVHYRPSTMPNADGHSLGNANAVKADVLFAFVRERVLR